MVIICIKLWCVPPPPKHSIYPNPSHFTQLFVKCESHSVLRSEVILAIKHLQLLIKHMIEFCQRLAAKWKGFKKKWAADALWASTPESLADSRAWELLRHAGRQVSGGFLDGFKLWYFSSRTRTASHKRLIASSIIPFQGPVMWLSKFVSCCTCWRRLKYLFGGCAPPRCFWLRSSG